MYCKPWFVEASMDWRIIRNAFRNQGYWVNFTNYQAIEVKQEQCHSASGKTASSKRIDDH